MIAAAITRMLKLVLVKRTIDGGVWVADTSAPVLQVNTFPQTPSDKGTPFFRCRVPRMVYLFGSRFFVESSLCQAMANTVCLPMLDLPSCPHECRRRLPLLPQAALEETVPRPWPKSFSEPMAFAVSPALRRLMPRRFPRRGVPLAII